MSVKFRAAKTILGFNAISLIHLLRLDFGRFAGGPLAAFTASNRVTSAALRHIPEVELDEILGTRRPTIRLTVGRYEDGMLPSHEALALLAILVAEGPAEVLEIGTYMGHTTRQMAENLPTATIHTVDLPEDFVPENKRGDGPPKDDFHLIHQRVVGREFRGHPAAARIVQHFGDTAVWNFHDARRPTFFFIDGAHTYEYCRSDSEKCLELCSGRGVFFWHDCDDDHPGVVRLISEWHALGRGIVRLKGTALAYWKSGG